MDDFFISGASCVDGPSTCTNPQRGLPNRECLLPSLLRTGPLTQLVRVKVSGDAPDVLFLQLETKCLLENPLFHARSC